MSPGRIALGYAVIAILWIAFSDALVTYLKLDPAVMTIKGTLFVFVTAALLYFTIRRLVQAVQLTSRERDETARLYRTVVEASNEGICLLDESGRISFLNGRLAAMLGRPAAELQGRRLQDFIEEPRVLAQRGAQQSQTLECRLRKDSDPKLWVLISRRPVLNDAGEVVQWVGAVIDITERKQAEEALGRLNRELRAISNCNQILLRATDEQNLLQEICRIVCEEAGYRMAWVSYAEHDEAKSVRPVAWTGADGGYLASAGITWADTDRGRGHTGTAIRSGKSCCIQDFAKDPRLAPWREGLLRRGFCSGIALPLKDENGGAFGSLSVHSAQPNAFTPEEIRLLEELAGDLAFGITTLRSRAARQRAEESLRDSETRFRTLVDHAPDALFIFDLEQGTIVDVNQHACESLGYTRRELIGTTAVDFHLDSDRANIESVAKRAAAGETVIDTHRHRRKDGTLFTVEAHTSQFWYGGRRFLLKVARDVSDRLRAEEEARNTAAQWQATFDAVQDLVLLLDKDFRILRANRAAAEFLGLPFDKIVGGHCYGLIHGTSMPPAECPLARMRQSRRHEEVEVLAREGGPWLSVSVDPVFDQNGELTHAVHVARDITDRKRAEDALRRSEACLAEGQRLSHTGSWAWSPVTLQSLYWSEEMSRIFGFNPREGVPTFETIWRRIHPEDRDRVRELQMKVARQSLDYEHDHRVVLPDGTVRHIHAIGHPVHDEAGNLIEYVGTAMDVTELKRAEEALRRSEAYLAEGQRLAHMGSWAWCPATRQSLYWSEEMIRIYGLNPRDGVPTAETFWRRIHPEDLDRTRELLLEVAAGNRKYEHDHRIVLPDGTVKHIHAIGHPVLDQNGRVAEYVGTAVDVTERKRTEEELRKHREHLEDLVKQRTEELAEAKVRAEAANREKSRFLANMSHELRTPLNAVLGFSRLLKNGPDVTPHQQESLEIIVRSGEHLLNLINNVLDMAKIESGRVALEESEVDLHRLLHEMQSLMGVGAVEKGLRFALEHDPDLPGFVAVDTGKLRQVLLNLLGNAIKYTDSGGVKLRARLASIHGSQEAKVRFEVEDSGPGISQQDCQRIFLPFVQLGDQVPAQAGTGLGLAICKQYVELMGGQIGVASQPGKGSVFYFTIPVRVLPSVAERDEMKHPRILGLAEGQPACRLLIVEDQPENRLLLRRVLEPLGFELRDAANGQEAVALFEQWHPDLIWMDIRMPVMDGLEAVRRIRATEAGAKTKIVALTAHALEEEREPIMAAGCDDLVRKPFREQELFGALARHLGLKFIYDKAPRPESAREAPELALRPEQLDALPAELLRDLRQAVVELDTARTRALIERVSERDASLGRALNTLATQLDYQRLLKLLERQAL